MLISASGTRFPRAVVEPPRLAPAGSPLDALFPQESRTFRSNQLCIKFRQPMELKVLLWANWIGNSFDERYTRALLFFHISFT